MYNIILIASHDYVPLGFLAEGKDEVLAYINACRSAADRIKAFAEAFKASPAKTHVE